MINNKVIKGNDLRRCVNSPIMKINIDHFTSDFISGKIFFLV